MIVSPSPFAGTIIGEPPSSPEVTRHSGGLRAGAGLPSMASSRGAYEPEHPETTAASASAGTCVIDGAALLAGRFELHESPGRDREACAAASSDECRGPWRRDCGCRGGL